LGVPLTERTRLANVAVYALLDCVSIAATHRMTLEKAGVLYILFHFEGDTDVS